MFVSALLASAALLLDDGFVPQINLIMLETPGSAAVIASLTIVPIVVPALGLLVVELPLAAGAVACPHTPKEIVIMARHAIKILIDEG